MKPLDDLDHYAVLEVPPGAGYEDIERAYEMTRAAYTNGSMALYSIFSSDDASVIRNRIDEAYRVLADPENRERYDAEAGISGDPAATRSEDGRGKSVAAPGPGSLVFAGDGRPSVAAAELSSAIEVLEDLDAELDEEKREFDGAALRRARLRRGVELDQIADVTKVRVTFLQCIEEEAFDQLPSSVYVRGFVHAYARAIGLDARRVASSYMVRVDAARSRSRRPPQSASL
jgi:curved DNA-binding protein CbpA